MTIERVPEDLEPIAGTRLHVMEDGGILFCEPTQNIYALNELATFIWLCLEERESVIEIVEHASATFALTVTAAREYVYQVMSSWYETGVVNRQDAPLPVSAEKLQTAQFPAGNHMPLWAMPITAATRQYHLLDTTLQVRFTSAEQLIWVQQALAHLETLGHMPADIMIDIIEADGRFFLYRDREGIAVAPAINQVAPWVKSLFLQSAIERYDYLMQIHAGVVGMGDACIAIPGAAGAGKSTLTIALIRAGFTYFSDEVALLEHGLNRIRPVPLAIGIKSTGWETTAPFVDDLYSIAVHHRMDGKLVRYIPPGLVGNVAAPGTLGRIQAVIFPCYGIDNEAAIHRLTGIEGFKRLLAECMTIPGSLTQDDVSSMADWIRDTSFLDLRYASSEEAVKLIQSAVR